MAFLSSGNGGLKAAFIDLQISDKEVDEKLNSTLHAAVQPHSQHQVENVHESPCCSFLCVKNEKHARVKQLVSSLSWALEEHKVHTGHLLVFSVGDSPSIPMILGVAMKKPISHMFIKALLDSNEVLLTGDDDPEILPEFQSSHELMLELLQEHADNPDEVLNVKVQVWECNAFIVRGMGSALKSNPEKILCEFHLSSVKRNKKPAGPPIKLPFGLDKRLKKKRADKRRARKEDQVRVVRIRKQQKQKQQHEKPVSKTSKKTSGKKDIQIVSSSSNDGRASRAGSSHADGSGSDSTSSELPQGDCKEEITEPASSSSTMIGRDEEQAVPMSATVAQEEETAQKVAQDIETSDIKRAKVEEHVHASDQAYSKSYFSKTLGLSEGAVAVSSRSVCIQCKEKIVKNTVRFSWYHSKLKPPSWCHQHCLYQLTVASGLQQETITRLTEIVRDGRPGIHNPVADDAQRILNALQESLRGPQ